MEEKKKEKEQTEERRRYENLKAIFRHFSIDPNQQVKSSGNLGNGTEHFLKYGLICFEIYKINN